MGHGLVVEFARPLGVEREIELVVPAEFEARLGECIVADLGPGQTLGEVGRMGSDLVGDDAVAHILLGRQPQVLLGRDIAEHGSAVPADVGGADAGGDVVVGGGDVGDQGPEGIEGGLETVRQLLVHVLLDHLQGHMARALDHHLHIVLPGNPGQLAQGLQFGELGGIIGIGE